MITVYEVGTVKPVEYRTGAIRTYVSVDGGMSDNIRTALYDAEYTVVLAKRVSAAPAMSSTEPFGFSPGAYRRTTCPGGRSGGGR